jgi:hypothetical protein
LTPRGFYSADIEGEKKWKAIESKEDKVVSRPKETRKV